jgi:membrane associated rhomboid family serine protease
MRFRIPMIPLHDDNPTQIWPALTIAFIVICCLAFFWQISQGEAGYPRIVYGLGMIPVVLFAHAELPPEVALVPPAATLLTSMFLHGGFMHLAGNMLYLWIFGNNVEDAMGHGRFAVFYVTCGVAAALSQALIDPSSEVPMIGASGAVSGVLGAYLLLYPHARILVLVPLGFYLHATRLPAGWVLALWFLFQLLNSALAGDQPGGVAWMAHIGGFIAGMSLIPLFKYRRVPLFHPPQPAGWNSRWRR